VPPRERQQRSGARRGALSADLRQALRGEATRLARVEDPLARIRAVSDTFAAMDAELARFADVRYAAIVQLRRQGWSYERLAAASGLSKARIAQLRRGVHVGG
jgi:uncharacterized protein YerC